jgi:hypothetical protein
MGSLSDSAISGATKAYGGALEVPAPPSDEVVRMRPVSRIGRLNDLARGVYCDDRRLQLVLFAFMLLLYSPLLWISWRLSAHDPLDLTFNSMLDHLLRGKFDVDPKTVGIEGFARDGRVYAYWGIWCALLRLPLWLIRRMDLDITAWSCLAAVCLAGMAKVRTLLLLRRHGIQDRRAGWAVGLMLAYAVLGGSQIGYLRISIYQEVIFWSYAFAAVFVYLSVRGVVNRWFNLGTLSRMALCAGLALLTRVTTGVGLLLAMTLIVLVLAIQSGAGDTEAHPVWRLGPALAKRRMLIPLGILAVLIAAAGIINYFRWDNPATFANYDLYLENHRFPDWLPRAQNFGTFNFHRIPFALLYYFLPIWVPNGGNGQLLFARTQSHLFVRLEMPPSSFLFTDLLAFCFIALLAISLLRRRDGLKSAGQMAVALAVGLLVPCMLMLMYISLTYRYRMDFYPEIDFLAFLGLYALINHEAMLAAFARHRRWMTAGLLVSICSSFLALSLYDLALSPLGKPHSYYHHAVTFIYQLIAPLFGSHA